MISLFRSAHPKGEPSERSEVKRLRVARDLAISLRTDAESRDWPPYYSLTVQQAAEALLAIPAQRSQRIWNTYQQRLRSIGVVERAVITAAGYSAPDRLLWRREQAEGVIELLHALEKTTGFEGAAWMLLVEVCAGDTRLAALAFACGLRRTDLESWRQTQPDPEALAVLAALRGYPDL